VLADIWTVFWRDWLVLRRRLVKFILSRLVAPLLYLFAFGWGLGRSVDSQALSGAAVSYLEFLVPGILALNSMNLSFASVIPVHAERVYHKSLEEYLTAPIHPAAFVSGKVLAAVVRSMISSCVILFLAYLGGVSLSLGWLFAVALLINSVIFAELGFWAAMLLDTYEEVGQVNTYILLPMSFLCGTFFSLQTMPDWLAALLELLPLSHTSALLRSLALEQTCEPLSFLVLFIYVLLGFVLALRAYKHLAD